MKHYTTGLSRHLTKSHNPGFWLVRCACWASNRPLCCKDLLAILPPVHSRTMQRWIYKARDLGVITKVKGGYVSV